MMVISDTLLIESDKQPWGESNPQSAIQNDQVVERSKNL